MSERRYQPGEWRQHTYRPVDDNYPQSIENDHPSASSGGSDSFALLGFLRRLVLPGLAVWSAAALCDAPAWFRLVFVPVNAATLALFYLSRERASATRLRLLHLITIVGGGAAAELGRRMWFKDERRKQFGLSVFVGCVVLLSFADQVTGSPKTTHEAQSVPTGAHQHGGHEGRALPQQRSRDFGHKPQLGA